jgi:hypothetical protein
VSNALEQLKPFAHESQRLEKAIKDLTSSLDSNSWPDEMHLNSKDGNNVFVYWRQATDLLELLLKPGTKTEASQDQSDKEFKSIYNNSKTDMVTSAATIAIEQALADLARASLLISETVLLENENLIALNPKNQKQVSDALAKAMQLLNEANAFLVDDYFGKAMRSYLSSWNKTQDAIAAAASR